MNGWMRVSAVHSINVGDSRITHELARIEELRRKYPELSVTYTDARKRPVLYESADVWIPCEIEKWDGLRT